MPEKFQSRCAAPSQRPWTGPIARGVSRGAAGRAASRSVTAVVVDLPPVSRGYAYLSHFAAFTAASKMLPLLVQTKRDRPMRLAASTVPQALQHCEVSAGSMTMIRDPYLKICTLA